MKIVLKGFAMVLFLFSGLTAAAGVSGFVAQQVANQISRSASNAISKNLADRLLIPTLKIENESGEVEDLYISDDSKLLVLLHDDASVRVWDLEQGIQRPTIKSQGKDIKQVLAISMHNLVVTGGKNGELVFYETLTGQVRKKTPSNNGDVVSLSLTKDEKSLLVAYENGVIVTWDVLSFLKGSEINTDHDDDIEFILTEANNDHFIIAGEGGFVERWSIKQGKKIADIANDIDDVKGLWNDQAGQILYMLEDGKIQGNGSLTADLARTVDDLVSITVNDDLSKIAVSSENKTISFFDADSMNLLGQIKSDKVFYQLNFINNNKQLLAADEKGVLHLFDVSTTKELLKLISTETGWTVVDNKGRFDSSEQGMENISWETEESELPIENFSAEYYEPGVLASHLDDQKFINETPQIVQQGIKLPPEVTLVIPDGQRKALVPIKISVKVQGLGGGIKEVKLYHNGKVVDPGSLVNSLQESKDKLISKTLEYKLIPTVDENTFKVIALNNMGIEGTSVKLSIDFEGEKQKRVLHVLTIGINQYQDSRLNLDYSVADATQISNIFRNSDLAVYDEMVQHQIKDKEATKAGILKQLSQISQYSQNDVVVLYLAGHGVAIDGEWYYLPHETMLQDSQQYYTQVGIAAKEIQQSLVNSKVQHVMVMVDACYSGAGLQAFRKLQDTQRHFSRKLSKSVGVVVLAATRKDQEAAELSDLGHGLFTYVVSEGMVGKADLKPRNSMISAHELSDFSTETIPAFSKKYLGAAQEPTSFTMGSDFELLRKE